MDFPSNATSNLLTVPFCLFIDASAGLVNFHATGTPGYLNQPMRRFRCAKYSVIVSTEKVFRQF